MPSARSPSTWNEIAAAISTSICSRVSAASACSFRCGGTLLLSWSKHREKPESVPPLLPRRVPLGREHRSARRPAPGRSRQAVGGVEAHAQCDCRGPRLLPNVSRLRFPVPRHQSGAQASRWETPFRFGSESLYGRLSTRQIVIDDRAVGEHERQRRVDGCEIERREAVHDLLRGCTSIERSDHRLERHAGPADAKHTVVVFADRGRASIECLHPPRIARRCAAYEVGRSGGQARQRRARGPGAARRPVPRRRVDRRSGRMQQPWQVLAWGPVGAPAGERPATRDQRRPKWCPTPQSTTRSTTST